MINEAINFYPVAGSVVFSGQCQARVKNPRWGVQGEVLASSLDSTLNPKHPLVADEAISFHPVVGSVSFCGHCQARVTNPRWGE